MSVGHDRRSGIMADESSLRSLMPEDEKCNVLILGERLTFGFNLRELGELRIIYTPYLARVFVEDDVLEVKL